MIDHVVNFMVANGIEPTVDAYLELAFIGDVKSLDQLEPEDAAEIESLIEDGVLKVLTPGSRRKQ